MKNQNPVHYDEIIVGSSILLSCKLSSYFHFCCIFVSKFTKIARILHLDFEKFLGEPPEHPFPSREGASPLPALSPCHFTTPPSAFNSQTSN